MARWLGAQGQITVVKMEKHALIVASPTENPNKSKLEDFPNP